MSNSNKKRAMHINQIKSYIDPIPYTPLTSGQAPDWYVDGMAIEVTIMDYPWYKPSTIGHWYTSYKHRPAKGESIDGIFIKDETDV